MTVVGAGVVGLFTAARLVARGYRDVRIMYESDHDLASHKAAGLVSLFALSDTSPIIKDCGAETFKFYNGMRLGNATASDAFGLPTDADTMMTMCTRTPRYAFSRKALSDFDPPGLRLGS